LLHEATIKRQSSGIDRRPAPPSMTARKATGQESSSANSLRQRIGNQAIQRLMGEVPGDLHRTAPLRAPAIQTKLAVSQPGDRHEQEANRVANAVMRMPAPDVQQKVTMSSSAPAAKVQRACAECDEEIGKKPGAQVHRKDRPPQRPHSRRQRRRISARCAVAAVRFPPTRAPFSSRDSGPISATCAYTRARARKKPLNR